MKICTISVLLVIIIIVKKIFIEDSMYMSKTVRIVLQVLVLIAGIIMMLTGILRGELHLILQKATVVCLECIGIG